jgi:cinnamoyl-CoA:phenyllactate CoA-transferase
MALEKLGVDYHKLKLLFPKLVYAMLTGYGLHGPERDSPVSIGVLYE